MTSILDEFKRREGESFGDDLTPSTAEASKAIIPPCANEITILSTHHDESYKPKLAKVWSDAKSDAPKFPFYYTHTQRSVTTLIELHNTVEELACYPNSCVVRGSLNQDGVAAA